MNIVQPDPHPGRCHNFRLRSDGAVRCVDYEGVEHVCSFPPPPVVVTSTYAMASSIQTVTPKPWVKPGD